MFAPFLQKHAVKSPTLLRAVSWALYIKGIWHMKSKLEIYALSVCFAAMICLVISSGIGGYAIVRIFNPELTMSSYKYDQYQTNDAYWSGHSYRDTTEKTQINRPTKEELTAKRLESFSIAINGEKRQGVQTLIGSFIFLLVGLVTLLIHLIVAKKSRTKNV